MGRAQVDIRSNIHPWLCDVAQLYVGTWTRWGSHVFCVLEVCGLGVRLPVTQLIDCYNFVNEIKDD